MSSGVTVDLPTILEAVESEYSDMHEIRFNSWGQSFIENQQQEIVKSFTNLDDLYKWVMKILEDSDETK